MDTLTEPNQTEQSINPTTNPITTKTKSKTITKKNKDRNVDIASDPTSNKRKLNDSINNINNDQPNRKKRKLNETNNKHKKIFEYIQCLKNENKQLTKQRDEYKKGMNYYKKGMNHYKDGMLIYKNDIQSHAHSKTKNDIQSIIDNDININTIEESDEFTVPTPEPISFTNNTSNTNNNNSTIGNTNTNSIRNNKNKNKNKNKQCEFDNIFARLLEMGFDIIKISNALTLYNESGKDTEWIFNKVLNSLAKVEKNKSKSKDKHTNKKKKAKSNHSKALKTKPKKATSKSKSKCKKKMDDIDIEYLEFEKSYYISINCYICKQHFDDFYEYRDHIKDHYDNDPKREWKICDLGCRSRHQSPNDNSFVAHIAEHKKQRGFKCKLKNNGMKCNVICSTKGIMNTHWKDVHKKKQKTKIKKSNRIINRHNTNLIGGRINLEQYEFSDVLETWNLSEPLQSSELKNIFRPLVNKIYKKIEFQIQNNHKEIINKDVLNRFWKQQFEQQPRCNNNCKRWISALKEKIPNQQHYTQNACLNTFNQTIVAPVLDNLASIINSSRKRQSTIDIHRQQPMDIDQ